MGFYQQLPRLREGLERKYGTAKLTQRQRDILWSNAEAVTDEMSEQKEMAEAVKRKYAELVELTR